MSTQPIRINPLVAFLVLFIIITIVGVAGVMNKHDTTSSIIMVCGALGVFATILIDSISR